MADPFYISSPDSVVLKPFSREYVPIKKLVEEGTLDAEIVRMFLPIFKSALEENPNAKLVYDTTTGERRFIDEGMRLVPFTQTAVCGVISEDGGKLFYRDRPIDEVANWDPMKTASLLITGDVSEKTVRLITNTVANYMELPPQLYRHIFESDVRISEPMAVMRTAVSLLGNFSDHINLNRYNLLDKGHRWELANKLIGVGLDISAKMPTISASLLNIWEVKNMDRTKRLEEILDKITRPDPTNDYITNILSMYFKDEAKIDEFHEILKIYVNLHMSHGFNASTFTTTEIASTHSTLFAAMSAATGALQGPLHGGASKEVMEQWKRIKDYELGGLTDENVITDKIDTYVRNVLASGHSVFGEGHGKLKKGDKRATILEPMALAMIEKYGDKVYATIGKRIEYICREEKGLYPNVDFWSSPLLYHMGFKPDFNTVNFTIARSFGWLGAYIEQMFRNSVLIRPDGYFVSDNGKIR